jgi:hypothetical protein
VFVDAKANAYLSITARAEAPRDHAKAAEIWKTTDNMWWKGPDVRAAPTSAHRGIMGWAGEQDRGRVRVRQGATHWRKAEPRRESQKDRRYALIAHPHEPAFSARSGHF